MEYDVIPHYLKWAANFNKNTDTNKENTEKHFTYLAGI